MNDLDEYSIEENEKFRKSDYEHKATWQINWDASAGILKRAADLLLDAYHFKCAELDSHPGPHMSAEGVEGWMEHYDTALMRVHYMLIGYSIEDLIKGIIMSKHSKSLTDGLEKIIGHNTRELLRGDGITEFKVYDDILEELEKYVTWKGRYPIPKKDKDHEVVDEPIDLARLNKLYEKLYKRSKLERRLRKCNKEYHEFKDVQREIVSFIATPRMTMTRILEAYPQYSKELIIQVLEDYIEDLCDERKKQELRTTVGRWELGWDDEEILESI